MRRQLFIILFISLLFTIAAEAQNIARADSYFRKNDFENALIYYKKAIAGKENGYSGVYKKIVMCYTREGNYKSAIKYLGTRLGNSSSMIDSANIYCLYAQCYFELHNQKKASEYLRRAKKISTVVVIPKECRFFEEGYEYITTVGIEDIYYQPGSVIRKKGIVSVKVKHYWDGSTVMPDDKVKMTALVNNNIERYWKEWKRYIKEIVDERNGTAYSLWHLEFNCEKEEYRLLRVVEYDKNNNIIRTQNYPGLNRSLTAEVWKPIVPRSSVEEVYNKVCR